MKRARFVLMGSFAYLRETIPGGSWEYGLIQTIYPERSWVFHRLGEASSEEAAKEALMLGQRGPHKRTVTPWRRKRHGNA